MKKKYYILVLTFLCFLTGQNSFAQLDSGDFNQTVDFSLIPQDILEAINSINPADIVQSANPVPTADVKITLIVSNVNSTSSSSNSSSDSSSVSYFSWGISFANLSSLDLNNCWTCNITNDNNNLPSSDNSSNFTSISFGPELTFNWNSTNNNVIIYFTDYNGTDGNGAPLSWYIDKDGDGYDDGTATGPTAPDNGYIQGISKGKDCNDEVWSYDNKNCAAKKTWYLDNDTDGWYSQIQESETSPGEKWFETTSEGVDCNDAKYSLTNDCSISDPCAEIKNIFNYKSRYNNSLKSSVDYLKSVVSGSLNLEEEGYEITKNMNSDMTYRYGFEHVTKGTEFSVGLQTGGSIVGGFHSHPSTGVPIFSFQDLRHLLNLYDNAKTSYKSDVFEGVVAKDSNGNKNVYILKVDDIAKLRAQVNAIWNHPDYAEYTTDKDRIEAIHSVQADKFDKSNGQIEKSFLEQFSTAGISLYKADTSVSSFSKLTLNNGVATPTPCN